MTTQPEIPDNLRHAIDAACVHFALFGIDFRRPWECDLDDVEQERYEALCAVLSAALCDERNRTIEECAGIAERYKTVYPKAPKTIAAAIRALLK